MSETCGRTFNFVYLYSQERNVKKKKRSVWTAINKQQDDYCVNILQAPALRQLYDSASQLRPARFCFKSLHKQCILNCAAHMLCVHITRNVLPITHVETYRVSERKHHSSSVKHYSLHY